MIPTPKFQGLWMKAEAIARRQNGYASRLESDPNPPTGYYMKLLLQKVNALRKRDGEEAYVDETIKGKSIADIENEIGERQNG